MQEKLSLNPTLGFVVPRSSDMIWNLKLTFFRSIGNCKCISYKVAQKTLQSLSSKLSRRRLPLQQQQPHSPWAWKPFHFQVLSPSCKVNFGWPQYSGETGSILFLFFFESTCKKVAYWVDCSRMQRNLYWNYIPPSA